MINKEKWPYFIMASCLCFLLVSILSCASKNVQNTVSIDELTGIDNKLIWLKKNAASDSNYVFEVNGSERIVGGDSFVTPVLNTNLSYRGKSNITITIRGVGSDAELFPRSSREFTVGSGVTLILENVAIRGEGTSYGMLTGTRMNKSLVTVSSGGTLVMNDGSAITDNDSARSGGGVYVSDGGTFLMNGGLIAGNRAAISKRDIGNATGGGVFVSFGGTFTKTGGSITGYASDTNNGNVVWIPNKKDFTVELSNSPHGYAVYLEPDISNSHGHAVYAEFAGSRLLGVTIGSDFKRQERTAGPDVNLYVGNGTFSGDWDF